MSPKVASQRWEISQTWCGLDGGFSSFPGRMPLDKVIAQALYTEFPRIWDDAARSQLEATYQVAVVEQPEDAYTFCAIPDGAFRTIAFPIAVGNLRRMRQWMQGIIDDSPLAYPITVETKLVFQAINYLEGKAPAWTSQEVVAFNQSVEETGLAPQGFPVREEASDGSAAWTLRRESYFIFITLPFAGLTDFLSRMTSAHGPIRTILDPELRVALRPIIIPAGLESQTESLALWDKARTTRSFMQFVRPGEAKDVPRVQDLIEAEKTAAATLEKVEVISSDVVSAIEQIFHQVTKGNES